MSKNKTLHQKLSEYFNKNLKLSYVGTRNLIIVTEDDKVYEFERKSLLSSINGFLINDNTLELIASSSHQLVIESLINTSIVNELCYKQICDFKTSYFHTIARTSDGYIYCWGINTEGTLGNGIADKFKKYKPELNKYLVGKYVTNVCCGFRHSLVLTSDGEVYAFGSNKNGQIGNGGINDILIPYHINGFDGEKIKAISCGHFHSMALTNNGHVYIWGNYGIQESNRENFTQQISCDSFKSPFLFKFDVSFDKLECGVLGDLLLSVEGDLYNVPRNYNGEQYILQKLIKNDKLIDIAKKVTPDILQEISAAVSENGLFYVWGLINGELLSEPKESDFESFNDIFGHYLQSTYEPILKSIPRYVDDFVKDEKYVKNFKQFKEIKETNYEEVENRNKIIAMKKIESEKFHPQDLMENVLLSCECGAEIEKICFNDHTNSCVPMLRRSIERLKEKADILKTELDEINVNFIQNNNEILIFNEWARVKKFMIIETNMSHIMEKRLIEILKMSLKERFIDTILLCKKFEQEFDGIWSILIGTDLSCNRINCSNFLIIEFGEILVHIYSNMKSTNFVLNIDKHIEVLENGIQKRFWNPHMLNTWLTFHNFSNDSLNISERLLDKNIIKYFIDCNSLVPKDDENYLLSAFGVFVNISDFTQLRKRLMKQEFLTVIVGFVSNSKFIISFLSSYLMANILSEGNVFWEQYLKRNEALKRESVINLLICQITEWKTSSNTFDQLKFNSLKPFNRLLKFSDQIPQEVHYFAVWALNQLTMNDSKRYLALFKEDNCSSILSNLIQVKELKDNFKNLAKEVIIRNKL